MPQFFPNPQNLTALILPVSVEFLLSAGPVVACIGRLRPFLFFRWSSKVCAVWKSRWPMVRAKRVILGQLYIKGSEVGLQSLWVVSESKVCDGCKDVHGTEISRLIRWPAIKSSVGGGFMECPSFSEKNLMQSILSFYKDRTFYDQSLREKTSSE